MCMDGVNGSVGLGWWEVLKGLHRSASESLLQVSMQGGVLDR
jgi:hypothetical protein